MKRTKILALILAVAFIVSTLAACGSQSNSGQTGTQSAITTSAATEATQKATQEELKQVELIYYTNGNGQPPETNLVEEAMSKILLEKIKATIKLNFIPWGDYPNKMNVLAASGDAFDVCFSANWRDYGPMVAKGAYADMTDIMPKYASEYMNEMPAYVIEAAKVKGKLYAAPNLQGLGAAPKLFVNSEIFDKYKLPESINSMDDLDTYIDAIKNGEKGMTPLYGYTSGGGFVPFGYYLKKSSLYEISGPVGWYDSNFKVVNQFESDAAKAWYKWARKAYQKGWIAKGAATQKDDSNLLKSQKFAMIFAGSSPQFDSSNWAAYEPVKFKAIDIGVKPSVTTGNCTSTMLSINVNSQNKERAMMFINLINTDKQLYNTMCYGVENKHYVLKDGFVDLPDGVAADKLGYNPGSNWAFGFTYNAYPRKGEDPNVGQKQLEYDKQAFPEPALGFTFDAEPVKTEITNVQSVLEEFGPSLEIGMVDPDTGLANLLEKLKGAGMDKIMAEKQKQLDEWRASNSK